MPSPQPDINMFSLIDTYIEGKPIVATAASHGRLKVERAPNVIQFVEASRFLAGPDALYPEQYNILRDFYELLCPYCNDGPSILTNEVPRDEQVLFEFGVCPECGCKKADIAERLVFPNTLAGCAGQRSTKSAIAAFIGSYLLHEYLCIDDPQEKLKVLPRQELIGSFAAAGGVQASETEWAIFKGLYDESPWFRAIKEELQLQEKYNPKLHAEDLYQESETKINFKHKHIKYQSVPSNAATQRGKTRIFACIGELSWLDSGDSKRSANQVYRAMRNSLVTVRASVAALRKQGEYAVPDAVMACVSSPVHTEDRMMRLIKEAEQNKRIFAFHKATWEINPTITRESLDDDFAADPIGADRDFGANPPGASNPFIPDPVVVDICVDQNRKNMFDLREDFFEEMVRQNDVAHVFRYVRMVLLSIHFNPIIRYVMHCDAGQSKDSFCMAVGHKDGDKRIIDGALECRPVVGKVGGQHSRVVHFPSMIDFIINLFEKRHMHLEMVTYDNWQSTDHSQRLIAKKILAYQKNITRDEHISFRQGLVGRTVSLPSEEVGVFDPHTDRNKPCSKAIYELKHLNDTGLKVDHEVSGTSDMIQCYVGVDRILTNPESITKLIKKTNMYQQRSGSSPRARSVRLRR